jgi:hypothetical protein
MDVMDEPLDLPWDDDLLSFFSPVGRMDEEHQDGFDLRSLVAPVADESDFLCVKQEHTIAIDYDFSLLDSLGSLGDLNKRRAFPKDTSIMTPFTVCSDGAAQTLGTAEIISDQRMSYVFGMLMVHHRSLSLRPKVTPLPPG